MTTTAGPNQAAAAPKWFRRVDGAAQQVVVENGAAQAGDDRRVGYDFMRRNDHGFRDRVRREHTAARAALPGTLGRGSLNWNETLPWEAPL